MIKPNWEIFSANSANKENDFEWFSYLLFCREFNLPKGWFGFKNQSAIEKSPIEINDEIIGFQAKFYSSQLSDHKNDFLQMLEKAKRDYPRLTKILIYTNQLWGQAYSRKEKKQTEPQALKDILSKAKELKIEVVWREASFFESEFVCIENDDLSRYFFSQKLMQGWQRFGDWSNTKAEVNAVYFVDEDVKLISPNHQRDIEINVIEGINEIREKLKNFSSSIRLVGLSGVGKTRFVQALFDERIGKNSLNYKDVWYCDLGDSPLPLPEHFISELIAKNKPYILVVDNCGQDTHSNLTNKIQDTPISIITIEYDVKDDLPANTDVYKLKPVSQEIIKKVIERHYPSISDLNSRKIAEFSGGNYRLALAISSNIERTDNLSILNDGQLFERLFWQQGHKNDDLYRIAQVFSLVYSFNIEDSGFENSEIDLLANLAGVTPNLAIEAIETLREKDIVQQRGCWRAVLPHAVANRLTKELISKKLVSQLNEYCQQMPQRLQQSCIKRLSYLHDQPKIRDLVKSWFEPNGWLGKKLLNNNFEGKDLIYMRLLASINEEQLLYLFEEKSHITPDFLTTKNPHYIEISRLIRRLAYQEHLFKRSFDLLVKYSKNEKGGYDSAIQELIAPLFRLYTSESLANLEIKKIAINEIKEKPEYQSLLLKIIDTALKFHDYGYVSRENNDNGQFSSYGYQPKTYEERLEWVDFLLNILDQFDMKGLRIARKIFVSHLKDIIWTCGGVDLVKFYLEKFNERIYFSEAHTQILNIIKSNKHELDRFPENLMHIQNLEKILRPQKNNITELIKAYILVPDNDLYSFIKNKDENKVVKISEFNSYEELIIYIAMSLNNIDNIVEVLSLLIKANSRGIKNNYFYQLGEISAGEFSDVKKIAGILKHVNIDKNLLSSEFLVGILQGLRSRSLSDFYYLIEFMVKDKKFKNIVFELIFQSAKNDFDFLYLSDLVKQRRILVPNFMMLSFNKNRNIINNNQFEILIDALIDIGEHEKVIKELLEECFYQNKLEEKYISVITENLYGVLSNNFFDDFVCETVCFLLNVNNDIKIKIFKIVKKMFDSKNYISLYEHDNKFELFKTLITNSTTEFIKFFCEDEKFINKFLLDKLSQILIYANEKEVLEWIGSDQERIKFWIYNSSLIIIKDNNEIFWLNLIMHFLERSRSPYQTLEEIIQNNIFEFKGSTVYSGSWSDVLRGRLPYFTALTNKLKFSHSELLPLIHQKEQEWLKLIDKQSRKDDKDSRHKNESFDW